MVVENALDLKFHITVYQLFLYFVALYARLNYKLFMNWSQYVAAHLQLVKLHIVLGRHSCCCTASWNLLILFRAVHLSGPTI